MRVCASINWYPFQHEAQRFGSIRAALDYFGEHADRGFVSAYDDERATMDLYPDEHAAGMVCDSVATYHDSPMVRYTVGPRGGIRKA